MGQTRVVCVAVAVSFAVLATLWPGQRSERPKHESARDNFHAPTTRHELFFGLTIQDQKCAAMTSTFSPMMDKRGGGVCLAREVSDGEFQTFLDEEVVPRFPDGFTVLQGSGHYAFQGDQSASNGDAKPAIPVTEKSRVLVLLDIGADESVTSKEPALLLRPNGTEPLGLTPFGAEFRDSVAQRIVDVAGMYRWYFQQESVLWVKSRASSAFI